MQFASLRWCHLNWPPLLDINYRTCTLFHTLGSDSTSACFSSKGGETFCSPLHHRRPVSFPDKFQLVLPAAWLHLMRLSSHSLKRLTLKAGQHEGQVDQFWLHQRERTHGVTLNQMSSTLFLVTHCPAYVSLLQLTWFKSKKIFRLKFNGSLSITHSFHSLKTFLYEIKWNLVSTIFKNVRYVLFLLTHCGKKYLIPVSLFLWVCSFLNCRSHRTGQWVRAQHRAAFTIIVFN